MAGLSWIYTTIIIIVGENNGKIQTDPFYGGGFQV